MTENEHMTQLLHNQFKCLIVTIMNLLKLPKYKVSTATPLGQLTTVTYVL